MTEKQFSHVNPDGKARMVDVSGKPDQLRIARAEGVIKLQAETIRLIMENQLKKGDVLTIAEIAGIQAAKQAYNLIPLCHQLLLNQVKVIAQLIKDGVKVTAEVRCIGNTGVEMEALTAVSVALLTIYDMCKAVDKQLLIHNIHLIDKTKSSL
jgi:cyclic pyranopterin monophosphate synthase